MIVSFCSKSVSTSQIINRKDRNPRQPRCTTPNGDGGGKIGEKLTAGIGKENGLLDQPRRCQEMNTKF